jgi:hypothetical protein
MIAAGWCAAVVSEKSTWTPDVWVSLVASAVGLLAVALAWRASNRAAAAAESSARTADALARVELDRRHDELAPRFNYTAGEDKGALHTHIRNVGGRTWRLRVAVRSLEADGTYGGRREVAVDVLEPGTFRDVVITLWQGGDRAACIEVIADPSGWPCPCTRSVPSGHWRATFLPKLGAEQEVVWEPAV